uniref:Uncharacterized protein n=1 Tax=Echinococcus granulosus TaxID=6210 RepID=A0A068W8S7_ECHGR|nr:hypothetical protein EgrG_000883700 [Echinococcus granulosus]
MRRRLMWITNLRRLTEEGLKCRRLLPNPNPEFGTMAAIKAYDVHFSHVTIDKERGLSMRYRAREGLYLIPSPPSQLCECEDAPSRILLFAPSRDRLALHRPCGNPFVGRGALTSELTQKISSIHSLLPLCCISG